MVCQYEVRPWCTFRNEARRVVLSILIHARSITAEKSSIFAKHPRCFRLSFFIRFSVSGNLRLSSPSKRCLVISFGPLNSKKSTM